MPTPFTVTAHPFTCPLTNTPSLRIQLTYPSLPNLSYNFQLTIKLYLQTILPKITYSLVHEEQYLIPKTQVVFQNLEESKMYKVQVRWGKRKENGGEKEGGNVGEEKVVYVCSGKVEREESVGEEEEVGERDYGRFVKDNIHGYFDQYYPNQPTNSSRTPSSKPPPTPHRTTPSSAKNPHQSSKKHPISNSQSLIKAIGQSDPFINPKNLQKYILEGRKSKNVKDYLTTKDYQCFNSCSKVYKNEVERRRHVEKTLLVSKAINMLGQIYQFDRENGILEQTTQTNLSKGSQQKRGRQFFKNDWFMGPFYSYDANERQMKKRQSKEEK